MTEDEIERRAKALACVIAEFFPGTDAQDPTLMERDLKEGTIAESKAYWLVYSLEDPVGELGVWRVDKQEALLDEALQGLRVVDEALRKLASPVASAVSRNTKIGRGLVIPPPAAMVLAARNVRLEQLPDNAVPIRWEANLIEDASDPSKEVTIRIGTVRQTAPVLIREIRKAMLDTKAKVRDVIAQGHSDSTVRLDHRRWSAIRAYLGLRGLWETDFGALPAHYPKESDPFYAFAERALEALEIPGIGGRPYASVRSTYEAIGKLEKEGFNLVRS